MTSDMQTFKETSKILKGAVTVLEQRISDVEQSTLSRSSQDESNVLKVFYKRSLDVYKDTIIYLSEQIQKEATDFDNHTLPVTRKLYDIYIRFIHLQEKCDSDTERALTCIAYQLQSYSFMKNKKLYEELLILYKPIIEASNYNFPTFDKHDYIWYQRTSGLAFKGTRDLFKKEVILKYSDRSNGGFKGEKLVDIYGGISEISHGNPYYSSINDRFWVITSSLMVTSLILEIIDNFILQKPKRKDYRMWKNDLLMLNNEILALWTKKEVEILR